MKHCLNVFGVWKVFKCFILLHIHYCTVKYIYNKISINAVNQGDDMCEQIQLS